MMKSLKKYLQTETGKIMSIIIRKVREEIFLKKSNHGAR